MSVGMSDRTKGKHALLNKLLGREFGVISNSVNLWEKSRTLPKAVRGNHRMPNLFSDGRLILDLCAGDGQSTMQSGTSSPEIIRHHCSNYRNYGYLSRWNCKVVLCERDSISYTKLKRKILEFPGYVDVTPVFADVRSPDFLTEAMFDFSGYSSAFVHADPNKITDWPITKELINNLPYNTTWLITMGCNAGGLKRLPWSERKQWYTLMDDFLGSRPQHHDTLLVYLEKDSAQWAYMVSGPQCWQGEYEKDAVKAFSYWPKGISGCWASHEMFGDYLDWLFKSRAELPLNFSLSSITNLNNAPQTTGNTDSTQLELFGFTA